MINLISKKKLKGISLIEVLIYLAIFSLIFGVIIQYMLSVSENNRKTFLKRDAGNTTIFVSEHLKIDFALATSIDTVNSTFNNSNGKIRLLLPSGYVEYTVLNNRINVNKNGVNNYITTNKFYVTNFYVEQVLSQSNTLAGARFTIDFYPLKNSISSSRLQTMFILK